MDSFSDSDGEINIFSTNQPATANNVTKDNEQKQKKEEEIHKKALNTNATNISTSSKTSSSAPSGFRDLGLFPWLVETLSSLSIHVPTPVQASVIPKLLEPGSLENAVAIARTGQGKTATFALPMLQKLSADPYGIYGVILTPTRELAFQMAEQIKVFGRYLGPVRLSVIVGGMDMMQQALELDRRPHIVIGTPGRLADLISANYGDREEDACDERIKSLFSRVAWLVLDEADRLIEPCFLPDLKKIISVLPPRERRQTVLASATNTQALTSVYEQWEKKPFIYDEVNLGGKVPDACSSQSTLFQNNCTDAQENALQPLFSTVSQLDQRYLTLPSKMKDVYLSYLLLQRPEFQGSKSILIFVSKCKLCDLLADTLKALDLRVVTLHSRLKQSERLKSLALFRSGAIPIMITTDISSRGLDIPSVAWVINYSIPLDARDYVHRVGRTARAGRGGAALSLVSEMDIKLVKFIESACGSKWKPLFEDEEDEGKDENDKKEDKDDDKKSEKKTNTTTSSSVTVKLPFEKQVMKLLKVVLQAKRTASLNLIQKESSESYQRRYKNKKKQA